MRLEYREARPPGPGRYSPEIAPIKNKAPEYIMGERNANYIQFLKFGTNQDVGPGSYRPENCLNKYKRVTGGPIPMEPKVNKRIKIIK